MFISTIRVMWSCLSQHYWFIFILFGILHNPQTYNAPNRVLLWINLTLYYWQHFSISIHDKDTIVIISWIKIKVTIYMKPDQILFLVYPTYYINSKVDVVNVLYSLRNNIVINTQNEYSVACCFLVCWFTRPRAFVYVYNDNG